MAGDFVPPEEVADRFDRLKVVVERSALAKHAARVGRVEEALVEGPSKKDPSVLTGRTRQGKLVHFTPPAGGLRPGAFVSVRIDKASPHHLMGTLVGDRGTLPAGSADRHAPLAGGGDRDATLDGGRSARAGGRRAPAIPVGVPIHASPEPVRSSPM